MLLPKPHSKFGYIYISLNFIRNKEIQQDNLILVVIESAHEFFTLMLIFFDTIETNSVR